MTDTTNERIDFKFREADSLEQAVQLAVGAASACWENLRGAGEFDSTRAKAVSDQLIAEVQRRFKATIDSYPAQAVGRSQALRDMTSEVYANCVEKGFEPDEGRTFGDEIALLHSEVSEAFETYRDIRFQERTRENGKPDDVASEFADIFIRLLHYAAVHGFDLAYEYERKMAFNRTRPYRHGGRVL